MQINHFKPTSLSRKVSSLGSYICTDSVQLVQGLMIGGILKYQKLLAELTIKWHVSNQQHKSEMNCPWMLFLLHKKRVFQARPDNVHVESQHVYTAHVRWLV